jgi:hypothetical protein
MKLQVYLCTSQHFHPVKDPYDPLCLVWIAVEGQYNQVKSKVYRSYNFVGMLNLAHQLADERGIKLTVLSTNIEAEMIYQLEHND